MARRILVHNPRKDTYTVLAECADGPLCVAKWHGPAAPVEVMEGFEIERRAYEQRVFSLSPRLFEADEGWLVVEWVGGISVREALWLRLDDAGLADVPEVIGTAMAAIAGMHATTPTRPGSLTDFVRALRPVYFSFAASGPFATARPRWESVMTRTLARIGRPTFEARVSRLSARSPKVLARGASHGDLHLDNVVLATDGRVRVVDLANAHDGFPACDLIYALAAGLATVAHERDLRLLSELSARAALSAVDPQTTDAIVGIASQLSDVGAMNSRFNPRGRVRGRQAAYLLRAASRAIWPAR